MAPQTDYEFDLLLASLAEALRQTEARLLELRNITSIVRDPAEVLALTTGKQQS